MKIIDHPQTTLAKQANALAKDNSPSSLILGLSHCSKFDLKADPIIEALDSTRFSLNAEEEAELRQFFSNTSIVIIGEARQNKLIGRYISECPPEKSSPAASAELGALINSLTSITETEKAAISDMQSKGMSFRPGHYFSDVINEILPIGKRPHEYIDNWISTNFLFTDNEQGFNRIKLSMDSLVLLKHKSEEIGIKWLGLIAMTLSTERRKFNFHDYMAIEASLEKQDRIASTSCLAVSCDFDGASPEDLKLFCRMAGCIVGEIESDSLRRAFKALLDADEISGQFLDQNGQPTPIPWGHYAYLLENIEDYNYVWDAQDIGINVKEFTKFNLYNYRREKKKQGERIEISSSRANSIATLLTFPPSSMSEDDAPLEFLLLTDFRATALSGPLEGNSYEDHFAIYRALIVAALREGQYMLAACLHCMLITSSWCFYRSLIVDSDLKEISDWFSSLPGEARSALADMAKPIIRALLPEDIQREFIPHFDAEASKVEISQGVIDEVRSEARLLRAYGPSFKKLSPSSQKLLIDAEKKWEILSPELGTGNISSWGNIAGELFTVIECELKFRCGEIENNQTIRNYLSQRDKLTGGAYISLFKKLSRGKLPNDVRDAVLKCTSQMDISGDPGIWSDMYDALDLRNEAFHESIFTSEKLHRMREKILHRESGLLKRLIEIIR